MLALAALAALAVALVLLGAFAYYYFDAVRAQREAEASRQSAMERALHAHAASPFEQAVWATLVLPFLVPVRLWRLATGRHTGRQR